MLNAEETLRPVWAEINLKAIEHNINEIVKSWRY